MAGTKKKTMKSKELRDLCKAGRKDFQSIYVPYYKALIFKNLDLEGINFSGSAFDFGKFTDSNLENCNFSNTHLDRANFLRANLKNANFQGAWLNRVRFENANLQGANLSNTNLRGAYFEGADLRNTNLQGADLLSANFKDAKLQGANLSSALCNDRNEFPEDFDPVAAGAYLIAPGSDLRGANLQNTDLQGADLSNADLRGANLQNTNLQKARLYNANLEGANLQGAALPWIFMMKGANLTGANLAQASIYIWKEDKEDNEPTETEVFLDGENLDELLLSNGIIFDNPQVSEETQNTINPTLPLEIDELGTATENLDDEEYFNPKSIKEAKEQITISIARRQGQSKFRLSLLKAYNYRCAITGCDAQEALEAAHIIPFCEIENNHPSNGLLLRADLHTLFDLDLIAIDPETMKVHLAPSLCGTYYGDLDGKSMGLPKNKKYFPKKEALEWRCNQCSWYS